MWLFNETSKGLSAVELVRRIKHAPPEKRAELADQLDAICNHAFPENVGGQKGCNFCGLDAIYGFSKKRNRWVILFVS